MSSCGPVGLSVMVDSRSGGSGSDGGDALAGQGAVDLAPEVLLLSLMAERVALWGFDAEQGFDDCVGVYLAGGFLLEGFELLDDGAGGYQGVFPGDARPGS